MRLRTSAPWLALITVLLIALTGGCMSSSGKDAPLPVMAKADAQAWAAHMTEYMAQTAGVQLTPSTISPDFEKCVGKHDEVATDGRYYLMYSVTGPLPLEQHPEALRKVRDLLRQQGFTIKGYQETWQGRTAVLLDAVHPKSNYFVSAETGGGPDRVLFQVYTPCLMPPASPSPSS